MTPSPARAGTSFKAAAKYVTGVAALPHPRAFIHGPSFMAFIDLRARAFEP
ncbi:MAG TPA: hypothetical protein VFZ16_14735 [Hyphomicrobiaceae bacterium]|nr:hypothetical protein [Hyphomicrobiaceae bacterium]